MINLVLIQTTDMYPLKIIILVYQRISANDHWMTLSKQYIRMDGNRTLFSFRKPGRRGSCNGQPERVSSSLVGCPIHSALSHV